MSKTVRFSDKDKALIERMEKYKKERRYRYLVDVVRELCDAALTLKDISK